MTAALSPAEHDPWSSYAPGALNQLPPLPEPPEPRARPSRPPTVEGVAVIDLTDLAPWEYWHESFSDARNRIWTVMESLPTGAPVVIRPGTFSPSEHLLGFTDAWCFLGRITIESDDVTRIREWTKAIRALIARGGQ